MVRLQFMIAHLNLYFECRQNKTRLGVHKRSYKWNYACVLCEKNASMSAVFGHTFCACVHDLFTAVFEIKKRLVNFENYYCIFYCSLTSIHHCFI